MTRFSPPPFVSSQTEFVFQLRIVCEDTNDGRKTKLICLKSKCFFPNPPPPPPPPNFPPPNPPKPPPPPPNPPLPELKPPQLPRLAPRAALISIHAVQKFVPLRDA